jgi:hypothetical protein
MDLFHRLIDLIDKNAEHIPEGDYIEICNVIKDLREKVKPPPFLFDQNEPMTLPESGSPIRMMTPEEVRAFLEELHEEWSYGDISAEEAMDHVTHLL